MNADGTPKVVYHQTGNDFTIFDVRKNGAGTRDNETPFGIFLKSSSRDIGLNGKNKWRFTRTSEIRSTHRIAKI